MTDFTKLIPKLKDWNSGRGIDIESWIGCVGDFEKAIGYSIIFWPEFVEFDGCVLRVNFSRESYEKFMNQYNGDKTSVEAVMNHLHIKDIHCYGCSNTREQLVYLGNLLKKIYTCKLIFQFPKKRFQVEFDDSYKENIDDYQITFYQSEGYRGISGCQN